MLNSYNSKLKTELDKLGKFTNNEIEYEDDHFADNEYVFLNPSRQIQTNLSNILQLCDWDIRELKEILILIKNQ